MDRKKHFEKYYSRLRWEGIIKASLSGLIIGSAVAFAMAFISWFIGLKFGWWVAICLFVGVTVVSAVVFYFKKFRPTVASNAKRIDSLGLDERLITMIELENDQSYIAQRQREDATSKLQTVDVKSIRLKVARWAVVTSSVLAAVAIGMSTVSGLFAEGIIKSGVQLWESWFPPEEQIFFVEFIIEEGGHFEGGDELQGILLGGSTDEIIAVADDDGWVFDGWDDGYRNPVRTVDGVTGDMTLTAIFVPADEAGNPSDGPGAMGMEGDVPAKIPGQGQGKNPDTGDGPPSNGASGKYETYNQVINGNTFYGDVLGEYMNNSMQQLEQNNNLSAGMRDFVESYYDIIYIDSTENSDNQN